MPAAEGKLLHRGHAMATDARNQAGTLEGEEKPLEMVLGLLDKLQALDPQKIFHAPVQGVAGYYDKIKRPMCFQAMREKVQARKYRTWRSFVCDFELICSNARLFNPPQHKVHKLATTLLRAGKKILQTHELQGRRCLYALHPEGPKVAAAEEEAQILQLKDEPQRSSQLLIGTASLDAEERSIDQLGVVDGRVKEEPADAASLPVPDAEDLNAAHHLWSHTYMGLVNNDWGLLFRPLPESSLDALLQQLKQPVVFQPYLNPPAPPLHHTAPGKEQQQQQQDQQQQDGAKQGKALAAPAAAAAGPDWKRASSSVEWRCKWLELRMRELRNLLTILQPPSSISQSFPRPQPSLLPPPTTSADPGPSHGPAAAGAAAATAGLPPLHPPTTAAAAPLGASRAGAAAAAPGAGGLAGAPSLPPIAGSNSLAGSRELLLTGGGLLPSIAVQQQGVVLPQHVEALDLAGLRSQHPFFTQQCQLSWHLPQQLQQQGLHAALPGLLGQQQQALVQEPAAALIAAGGAAAVAAAEAGESGSRGLKRPREDGGSAGDGVQTLLAAAAAEAGGKLEDGKVRDALCDGTAAGPAAAAGVNKAEREGKQQCHRDEQQEGEEMDVDRTEGLATGTAAGGGEEAAAAAAGGQIAAMAPPTEAEAAAAAAAALAAASALQAELQQQLELQTAAAAIYSSLDVVELQLILVRSRLATAYGIDAGAAPDGVRVSSFAAAKLSQRRPAALARTTSFSGMVRGLGGWL